MLNMRVEPGTRRTLEAFGPLASEVRHDPVGSHRASEVGDSRRYLIPAQRRVLELYREVLATHEMPASERASILARIARIEAELQAYSGTTSRSEDDAQDSAPTQPGPGRAEPWSKHAA